MASPTPPQRDLTLLRHFREEMENTPRNDQQALLATLNKFGDQYAAEVERGAVSVEEAAEILTDVASDYLDVDQSAVLDPVLVKLDQAEERRLQRLEEPPKPTGPAARLIWDGDVVAQQSVRYLVDTILPETGVGLLVGQWGVYKTFVAMYLAACVITGQKFINFDVERKGGVLFLAETRGSADSLPSSPRACRHRPGRFCPGEGRRHRPILREHTI